MDDRIFDIAELVSKYMTGELTTEEQKCLDDWLILSGENRQWFDRRSVFSFLLFEGLA